MGRSPAQLRAIFASYHRRGVGASQLEMRTQVASRLRRARKLIRNRRYGVAQAPTAVRKRKPMPMGVKWRVITEGF